MLLWNTSLYEKILLFVLIFISILLINNKIYAYKEYNVGDEVLYNRMKFYVINNSNSDSNCVTDSDEFNQEKHIDKNDSKIVNEVTDIVSVSNT